MAQPMGLTMQIPDGYRLLEKDEVILKTDLCNNILKDTSNVTTWDQCPILAGGTPGDWGKNDVFIRKAEQEKEWLNPWD